MIKNYQNDQKWSNDQNDPNDPKKLNKIGTSKAFQKHQKFIYISNSSVFRASLAPLYNKKAKEYF